MSFASTLNGYCNAVNCTSKELAALSGVSTSTISRYRNGERAPDKDASVIGKLASSLALLSERDDTHKVLSAEEVKESLIASITESRMVGMDFNMRLDILMHTIGIRNAAMAQATRVDPSYISRIRKGSRKPADQPAFVDMASRLAAELCLDKNLTDEVGKLIGSANMAGEALDDDVDEGSSLAESIGKWLLGDEIVEADITELEMLFAWLDSKDFSEWIAIGDGNAGNASRQPETPTTSARFYYGIGGMRNAEIDFLNMARETHARELSMSSDMPLLQMELDQPFVAKYKDGIANLVKDGCHVNIVHGVERPLKETIRALRLWIPFYMTGRVTPYYLKGIHNRLFYHVNYVCDTCALASEAVIGHQEDGRYFFTTRHADVSYYQKKMGFILEKSSSLLEIYRECERGQREAFEKAEASWRAANHGRTVCSGQFKKLSIVSYSSDCTVLSLPMKTTAVHFVIRHPKINYAVAHMK